MICCCGYRVNAVAPGPVDTEQFKFECQQNPNQYWQDAQATCVFPPSFTSPILTSNITSTSLAQPVPPMAVARSILFLASEAWSSHITGQVLNVDSGKQGKVLWPKEELS